MAENPPKKARTDTSGPPPIFTSLSEFSRGSETNAKRYKNLAQAFKSKYGADPQFIARAPGRVNIIGEHIDYSGYGVLPMAIEQDIAIACRVVDTDTISVTNVDAERADYKGDLVLKIEVEGREWYKYVLCGIRGVKEYCCVEKLAGMEMLVDGNVPPASGLSSSSALVCCSALTTAYANKVDLPSKASFAELSAKCERYVGTEGGGMDQAISFLGEEGKAMMIEFDPVRSTEVTIPDGCVFVIANTLVPAEKAAGDSCYNVRVAECRLASLLIAHYQKVVGWENVRKLLQAQEACGRSLREMEELVSNCLQPGAYTRSKVCEVLGISEEQLQEKYLNKHTEKVQEFKIHDRAKHVFKEANHVYQFKDIANAQGGPDDAKRLGKLMDDSQSSCGNLYECSCPEIDEIVAIAKSAGSLGSRLTGAGWGGCVVSLVSEDKHVDLMDKLRDEYYKKGPHKVENIDASLFITKPGSGAALCDLAGSSEQ